MFPHIYDTLVDRSKPDINIGVADGWVSNLVIRQFKYDEPTFLDCPKSRCHFHNDPSWTLDWAHIDGFVRAQWSLEAALPLRPKPLDKPWFSSAYTMEEPEHVFALNKEHFDSVNADTAITYRLPDNMSAENFIHADLIAHPLEVFRDLKVGEDWLDRKINISALNYRCYEHRVEMLHNISKKIPVSLCVYVYSQREKGDRPTY